MSVETALVAFLATQSITRVYPDTLPQGADLPATVYQRISGVREQGFTRTVQGITVRMQLTTWAGTKAAVQGAADALRAALLTFTTAPVCGLLFDTDLSDYDPLTKLFRVITDVLITLTGDT